MLGKLCKANTICWISLSACCKNPISLHEYPPVRTAAITSPISSFSFVGLAGALDKVSATTFAVPRR